VNLYAHRSIGAVLIVTALVAASVLVPGVSGESRARSDSPSIERQYKGKLDPMGPFSWLDLDGRRWTEGDFRGKVLIVQQWAAWCGPCIAEFPDVQKLHDAVRHDPSIAFVSLNMDRDPSAIVEFLREFRTEYSFPVLFAGAQLKIKSLPHTWIVDREGYIREDVESSGADLVGQALALADVVKHRLPVSSLPLNVRQEMRAQNQKEGANSR
jgi:thiol-disulfide isomerase/thioredoxin